MSEDNLETGFLAADEARLFEADLYIAAMGRSGSTFLANLLTTPPRRWLMVEPWFVNGVFNRFIKERAAHFGWPTDLRHWHLPTPKRTRSAFLERYRNFLAPNLKALERWGAKGVRSEFHLPTIATINPKKVVVLVRNISDVSLSLLEKNFRQGKPDLESIQWVEKYCGESARSLLEVCDLKPVNDFRIVRYEDFLRSEMERRSIELWLNWPMDGDPFSFLGEFGRGYEVERHAVGAQPSQRQLPANTRAVVERISEQNSMYQRYFGY